MMNLYPEQLRQIAAMCEALNEAEGREAPDTGMAIQFRNGVPLVAEDGTPVGTLVDEVGGSWSFLPEGDDDE